jgi:hypothetical protein
VYQQRYSAYDAGSSALSFQFIEESDTLLQAEQNLDSATKLAATCYLAMATLVSGNDGIAWRVARESHDIAIRMNLFGVPPTDSLILAFHQLSPDKINELSFVAWGTYSWLS